MSKLKEVYICSNCGVEYPNWRGQCKCGAWNTIELQAVQLTKRSTKLFSENKEAQILAEVSLESANPFSCGFADVDRVLGKGLMPGSVVLIGGEPGIGKSTLILQIAAKVANSNKLVLYASGEESLAQIKDRARRIESLDKNLLAIATNSVEQIVPLLSDKSKPDLLIVDSVQTLSSNLADGLPGNVSQVRAVSSVLIEECKRNNVCLILIGHVTKDGTLAGPRLLEHMVDTVISLEGDRRQMFRLMRVLKNRFGPNEELLVFQMEEKGLKIIEDPSTYFLEARDTSLSGTSVVMTIDGQRPFAVEVQALVAKTYLAIPRRTALGFDSNRLNLLLAVLEKRLKLNLATVDIYAKVGGGIKIFEPGIDLAIIAAILSSYYDIPLPEKAVFWGEVDLNGHIRPVNGQNVRLNQAKRLGFKPIFYPDNNSNLVSLQKELFRK